MSILNPKFFKIFGAFGAENLEFYAQNLPKNLEFYVQKGPPPKKNTLIVIIQKRLAKLVWRKIARIRWYYALF